MASIARQVKAVAPSSQGWSTRCLCSSPAMAAVGTSAAGGSGSVCHHGARGCSRAEGSMNGTPPSAVVTVASQSQAAATIGSSMAPASSSTQNATSTGSGWLPGPRRSGSRAFPNPPSGFW
jgi:hypothetical protein